MCITYKAKKISQIKVSKMCMTANVLHSSIYEQKQVDFCQSEASLVYSSEFQASQEY